MATKSAGSTKVRFSPPSTSARSPGGGRQRRDTIDPRSLPDETDLKFGKWMDKADNVVLACRLQRHWWPDPFDIESFVLAAADDGDGLNVDQFCKRGCGCKRRQVMDPRTGRLDWSRTRVIRPPDYSLTEEQGGGWKMDQDRRGMMRKELLRRAGWGDLLS